MNNIWKIIKDYSFTKEEALDIYCSTVVDDIDNNDLKKLTLGYAIKYEIDEKKEAINNVLEYINSCFLTSKEKLDNLLSDNDYIEPNTKNIIRDFFINKNIWKISLIKADFNSKNNDIKEDIIIDWSLSEEKFLLSIEKLNNLTDKYASEWNIVMVWPYISDKELNDIKEIARDFMNNFKK